MDKKIKNYFGMGALVSMVILAISSLIFANIYSKSIEPSSYRSFSVSGEGKVVAIPDVAQFTFSVITEGGKDVGALQQENTQKANRAIALLKDNGVEDKDIRTAGYSLQPRYQYFSCPAGKNSSAKPCPPPEIIGYSLNQTVSVKIRDFEKAGEILSGVVQSGVNSVSELSFAIDDKTEIENEQKKTMRVIDYKTGKPDKHLRGIKNCQDLSSDECDDYLRQLVAYKLLFDRSVKINKGYKVESGKLIFIDSSETKDFKTHQAKITDETVKELEGVIKNCWKKINNLEFEKLPEPDDEKCGTKKRQLCDYYDICWG